MGENDYVLLSRNYNDNEKAKDRDCYDLKNLTTQNDKSHKKCNYSNIPSECELLKVHSGKHGKYGSERISPKSISHTLKNGETQESSYQTKEAKEGNYIFNFSLNDFSSVSSEKQENRQYQEIVKLKYEINRNY